MVNTRLIARNTVINFVGQLTPMVVALAAIPILIHELGAERFGVLTLAWMGIGYFSLFDLGLGRALTQLVAEQIGAGREENIPALTWTALLLMTLLGAVGAAVVYVISPWLVTDALKTPAAMQAETIRVFQILALSLPLVISTTGLRGVMEAYQRFGLANAIRVPMGLFTYLGPLLVLAFSRSLVPIITVLVAGRVVAWAAHVLVCLWAFPPLRKPVQLRWSLVAPMMRVGGWMTVSNIVSPLMVSLDRFLIGGLISLTAVAYYVTPYELVTKLWLVSGALIGVLFPAFAASFVSDRARTVALFDRGVRILFLALFPMVLVLVALAQEGLHLWLGAEFARNSTAILQWLAVGVFINSIGHVPFAVIQGTGRPDITGKLHLAELPLYVAAIWGFVALFGVVGVAIAWVVRVTFDTVVLFWVANHILHDRAILRNVFWMTVPALALLGIATVPEGAIARVAFVVVTLCGFALYAWHRVLKPEERRYALAQWERFRARPGGSSDETPGVGPPQPVVK